MTTPFELLEEQFAPCLVGNRIASTAMLAWFLENVWREEPDDVEMALCDGGNDKGIDAIVIDSDVREITVFQSKRRRTATRTQGDSDLRQFRGVAPYFRGPGGIDDLLAAAPNDELRQLVERLRLKELLAEDSQPPRAPAGARSCYSLNGGSGIRWANRRPESCARARRVLGASPAWSARVQWRG